MGNGIVVGHLGTDHDGFPPTPVTAGSATVRYDGVPAARLGDPLALTINQSIPRMAERLLRVLGR